MNAMFAFGRGFLTMGRVVFLTTLAVFALTLNSVWSSDHPTALLELSYALWAHHSVVLGKVGQFHPQSVDDFAYMGNYYTALAPGVSFLALPFVGLGFLLNGGFSLYGDPMILSEIFVALCNSVAAYLVFRLASDYFGTRTGAVLAFAYAFSSNAWPYGTFFFESDVSAMLDLLAVFLAARMVKEGSPRLGLAVLCGAALGAALTVDYINGVLLPIVSVYLLYAFRNDLGKFAKGFAGLLAFSAIGLVLLGAYNQAAFGSPFVTSQQAFEHYSILQAFSYPLPAGVYIDLFSPLRGVFVYCPLLLLGALGFWDARRKGRAMDFLLFLACFVGILIPYATWYDVAGGEGFGSRFLVPAIPFLLLPSGYAIESGRRADKAIAYALYATGVVFNGLSAIATSIPQVEAFSHFPFLTQVIPRLMTGPLEIWWASAAGHLWLVPVVLMIAVVLSLPLLVWAKSS